MTIELRTKMNREKDFNVLKESIDFIQGRKRELIENKI